MKTFYEMMRIFESADKDLEWAKNRAMEYLKKGEIRNAVLSMVSDLEKIGDSRHKNPMIGAMAMMAMNDAEEAEKFITGF
jgi:hypothetical protein